MNQWALCGSLSLLKVCSIRTLLQRPTMDLRWSQWWQPNTTRVCAITVQHVLHSTHLRGYGTGGNITLNMEYKYRGCCFHSEQRYLFNVSWHLMFSLATTREWPTMSAGSSKLWSKGTSCQEVSAHKNRWKAIRISRSILWVELILNLRFTPNSNQWFQRHFSKSHIRRDSK